MVAKWSKENSGVNKIGGEVILRDEGERRKRKYWSKKEVG